MLIAIIVVTLVLGTILAEGLAFLVYSKKSPVGRKRTLEFLLFGRHQPYTKESQVASQAALSRYAEHPFTGWSLGPDFRNIHGVKIHNRQGFRCDRDLEELDVGAYRIYCAGGSATYCTDIENNEDTWPHLLGEYLAERIGGPVEIINGAVGGFNTYQSYIRLSAYIDYLRPDLVVVYHAKNDLTPFYNGNPDNGKALPDYSNLMRSLNFRGMSDSITPLARWSSIVKLWALWRLSTENMSLGYVYDHRDAPDIPGLLAARTDFSIIETMQRNMIDLCRGRGVNLMYLTQRVEDPILNRHVQAINDRIRRLDNPDRGCFVYDLDRELPYNQDLLIDKMHYTPEGCRQVAAHLARYVHDSGLLNPVGEKVAQS